MPFIFLYLFSICSFYSLSSLLLLSIFYSLLCSLPLTSCFLILSLLFPLFSFFFWFVSCKSCFSFKIHSIYFLLPISLKVHYLTHWIFSSSPLPNTHSSPPSSAIYSFSDSPSSYFLLFLLLPQYCVFSYPIFHSFFCIFLNFFLFIFSFSP